MAADPYRYFRLEARELFAQLGAATLELEKSERAASQVQRVLRLAHTLKGAARVVGQAEIADLAHAMEDELTPFRDTAAAVPRGPIDAILHHIDDLGGRIDALSGARPAEASTDSAPAMDEGFRTVRTDMAEMDALLEGVSEAHRLLNGLRPAARAIEQGQQLAESLARQLGERPNVAAAPRTLSTATELRRCLTGLGRDFGSAIDQIDRELRQLRAATEQLRLVPATMLLAVLERTARDAAAALGKSVVFEGGGGEIRLDAYVLSTLQGALVQIVRNAVAHGIEPEDERLAAGKPAAGRVSVSMARKGRKIVIECRDDGGGVDLDAVLRMARRRGMVGAEVERFSAEELLRLLLRGGITTSEAATGVSGRGIGLDIVREALGKLGGEVVVHTEAGLGARFELVAPLSLAAIEALIVEIDGAAAAIPFDAVRRSVSVADADIIRTSSGAAVMFDQAVIPFIPLPKALYGARSPAGRNWPAVVVDDGRGLAAVGVDRLLGSERIVIRSLPEFAPVSPMVAGASLDAQGNPQLVLDPDGLLAEARQGKADFEQERVRHTVLVVDDSLTTRMLEQSILESAGYEVELATSAEEALELTPLRRYALFLVDVEMPGMDGFSFVERIRLDPILHDTPAVLVTSRNAPEDRQRGRDVGAQGYIVKSQFDQAELLTMIGKLIG